MKKTICGLAAGVLLTLPSRADDAMDYKAGGDACAVKGDWDGAIADYRKAMELKPDDPAIHLNCARAQQAKGDLAGALTNLDQTIGLKPGDAYAHVLRGTLKETRGDLAGALADYNGAIDELHFEVDFAYSNRGHAKAGLGDFPGAADDYGRAVALRADNVNAWLGRAGARQALGDYPRAQDDFSRAIGLKPGDFNAWLGRGTVRQVLGDLAGARVDYDQVIQLQPDYAPVYFNRGCLHYDRGAFHEALSDFRQVCALDPAGLGGYAHFRIWLTRARLGEADAATAELKDYWDHRPSGAPAGWPEKVAGLLSGRLAEPDFLQAAAVGGQKAVAEQPCEAFFYAGAKRLSQGDKTAAREYFQKCVGTGVKSFCEYQSAAAELKALTTAP